MTAATLTLLVMVFDDHRYWPEVTETCDAVVQALVKAQSAALATLELSVQVEYTPEPAPHDELQATVDATAALIAAAPNLQQLNLRLFDLPLSPLLSAMSSIVRKVEFS